VPLLLLPLALLLFLVDIKIFLALFDKLVQLVSMKILIITLCLLTFASTGQAATIKITGPCSETPLIESTLNNLDLHLNLGKITVDFLTREKISFVGSEYGINSINGTAVGDDALEILSDTKMRAYGWCYTINNIAIDKMPDETFLTKESDSISWFYAYATYDSGEWKDYCTPAYKAHNSNFCSQK
jgi:hypothetical protein